MSEKIDVFEFVEKYNSTSEKQGLLDKTVPKDTYVDYLVKQKYVRDILTVSCLDSNGNVKLNSCKKYMLYIYTVFTLYTNIDIPENKMVLAFDALDRYNLIDIILAEIPEAELNTFNTVLQMCQDDMITNNYEIHGYINRNIENITTEFSKVLYPIVSNLNKKLDEVDIEKLIQEFLKTLNN